MTFPGLIFCGFLIAFVFAAFGPLIGTIAGMAICLLWMAIRITLRTPGGSWALIMMLSLGIAAILGNYDLAPPWVGFSLVGVVFALCLWGNYVEGAPARARRQRKIAEEEQRIRERAESKRRAQAEMVKTATIQNIPSLATSMLPPARE